VTWPSDELVFTVSGATATRVDGVPIESLGLTERAHLQEWVIAHPDILGANVLIVAFEFDRWSSTTGTNPKDRLDVLGLGQDGRLLLAELKRGRAPDTVDLQAIKYAAMVSRFAEDSLAELHAEFLDRTQQLKLTGVEALEKLQAHAVAGLSADLLLRPRIVLLAEDFSPTVTSSVVWLNEQGVDISLRRYQAYRTGSGETMITVSQLYPVAEVGDFEVTPRLRSAVRQPSETLPEKPWNEDDLRLLHSLPFEVPHAVLDVCSEAPEGWVGSGSAYARAGVEQRSGMGKLAGFGYSVRSRFGRSNPPWDLNWAAGGESQQYYRVSCATAECWQAIRLNPVVTDGPDTETTVSSDEA
jgi:hypothetical protein